MANFQQFISTFDTENTKGGQFEKFCKWFLENDPSGKVGWVKSGYLKIFQTDGVIRMSV